MEDGVQHVERLPLLDGDDPFRVRPAGPLSGSAGGGSGALERSCQPYAGALVPYARGILRLQHVMFFNWCEPPMGASLSVLQGLISPERRNLFSRRPGGLSAARCCSSCRAPCRVAVWAPGPGLLGIVPGGRKECAS